ncbi:MAG TPA: M56 family metallopeptidase [Clostridiaceae bacterium]|nr:M56 family metallopeptidase [Clostridiaceae bacterium]
MIMDVIEFLCAWFYTSLNSAIAIMLVLIIRKLLGKRLWSDGRMILWLLVVIVMTVPAYPNFTYGLMVDSYLFPPFNIRFNQVGKLDGKFIIPTGNVEAVLKIWNGSGWNMYIGDGKIIGLVIFSIWITGFLFFIIWQLIVYLKLKSKLKKIEPSHDASLLSFMKSEQLYWGIRRDISIIIAPQKLLKEIKCPSVVGVKNPTVLIPLEQWHNLSESEKKAVITHELMHVKHNDNLKNFFLLLIQAAHWFNPLVWIALKRLRQDIEASRDSEIVRNLDNTNIQSYASAILNIARMNSKKYSVRPHSGMLCTSGVGLRINLISAKNRKSIFIGIVLTILSGILLFIVFYKWKLDIVGTYITIIH